MRKSFKIIGLAAISVAMLASCKHKEVKYQEASYPELGIKAAVEKIDSPDQKKAAVLHIDKDKFLKTKPEIEDTFDSVMVVNTFGQDVKGVFIADIGQDANPILTLLMDDNTIRTLSIFNSLENGLAEAPVTMVGFNNVVDFRAGGAGKWTDEDGNEAFSYNTIFAIDEEGNEQEIPINLREAPQYIYGQTPDKKPIEIILFEDWNMAYTIGEDDDAIYQEGTYVEFAPDDETDDESSKIIYEVDNGEGSFLLRMDIENKRGDEIYSITPLSGELFGAKDYGETLKFSSVAN